MPAAREMPSRMASVTTSAAALCRVMRLNCRGISAPRSSSTAPVARQNTVSPSARVWEGFSARASPAWAAEAVRLQSALLSTAFVATTTSVVFRGGTASEPVDGLGFPERTADGHPHGIDNGQAPYNDPVLQGDRSRPDSPFVRPPADDRSGAGPHVAAFDVVTFRLSGSGGSCRVAHLLVRARRKVTAAAEVEDRRRGDDRHEAAGHREAPAVFLAPALGTARCDQAEGAAAGEHHGVHPLRERGGIQGIRFGGRRAAAADVHGADRSGRRQHHRHPGEPAGVVRDTAVGLLDNSRSLDVAYPDPGDIGNRSHGSIVRPMQEMSVRSHAFRDPRRQLRPPKQTLCNTASNTALTGKEAFD